ncbi:MAG: hypothetical protein CMJ78_09585 [Planctomycetaceae bacterium]|nr:hypothetical protein [Planctomycetaceae bacterium]
MKVEQFLTHHGIQENPFAQEDANSDHVFQRFCLASTYHPAWNKINGDPEHPSTAVVFGEKGAGKTALRLQIVEHIEQYNREHPDGRVFIIEYDDFNPFLDCFRERFSGRKKRPEKVLTYWRLWDHMDAILSLGVTRLISSLFPKRSDGEPDSAELVTPKQLGRMDLQQKRDMLLLAAFYDHTLDLPPSYRWGRLKKKLRFSTFMSEIDRLAAVGLSGIVVGVYLYSFSVGVNLGVTWCAAIVLAAWLPWLWRQLGLFYKSWRISKQIRIIDHATNSLRKILSRFQRQQLLGQPLPTKERSDDRYESLQKFQRILESLGFTSIVVLVDRVDEPHLINGNAERMRDLLWPMFDNKFLQHPGLGFKLLLPSDVSYFLDREEKEFYERSRLDKQNLIRSLEWSGEALYDVASDRIGACLGEGDSGKKTALSDLFDEAMSQQELIGVFSRLRVPRHLFKYLHRLLVDHCSRYTEAEPCWKINRETVQTTLALYMRDLDSFDRGAGTG